MRECLRGVDATVYPLDLECAEGILDDLPVLVFQNKTIWMLIEQDYLQMYQEYENLIKFYIKGKKDFAPKICIFLVF
jgi:hypothetical protein